MMAVVHDLAEAQGTTKAKPPVSTPSLSSLSQRVRCLRYSFLSSFPPSSPPVGDIAPREGIPKAEKRRLEAVRPSAPRDACC